MDRMWMMFLVGWWCWCWWSCSSSAVASAAAIAEKTVEYKWQQPCPDHPDWQGYTSLEALQSELRQHDAWVVSSFSSSAIGTTATTEEDVHVVLEYPICPRTILNTTLQPLLIPPTLLEKYPLVILCLSPTSSEPSCIVRGGRTQVLVVESQQQQQQEPTTTASGSFFRTMAPQAQQLVQEGPSLTMQGLTFENSQDISLAILHATVTLQCVECHWTGCRGKSAVLLAEASEVASSVTGDETFRVRYTLHDHNIFGEHRRQERHRRQLNPNHEEDDDALLLLGGPTFYCIDCSFQDSGEVAAEGLETLLDADTLTTSTTSTAPFILMDSYRPHAQIHLESCTISKITGAFLMNALHSAQVTLNQVTMQDSSVSLGLVRVQYESVLTATQWTTRNNRGRATLICAHSSQAYLDGISFSDGSLTRTPILALSQGLVQLDSYCMTMASVQHAAMVVDSSSQWIAASALDNGFANRILTTETTTTTTFLIFNEAPPTFDCQGPIWHLEESANSISVPCWDIGHCTGTCHGLDLWRILEEDDVVVDDTTTTTTTTTITCPSVEVLLEATTQAQQNNNSSSSGNSRSSMAAAILVGSLGLVGLA